MWLYIVVIILIVVVVILVSIGLTFEFGTIRCGSGRIKTDRGCKLRNKRNCINNSDCSSELCIGGICEGRLLFGNECFTNEECNNDAFCDMNICRVNIGNVCILDSDCVSFGRCVSGLCIVTGDPLGEINDACPCRDGLVCDGGVCKSVDVCGVNEDCKVGYICDGSINCHKLSHKEGAVCSLFDSTCPFGFRCDGGDILKNGTQILSSLTSVVILQDILPFGTFVYSIDTNGNLYQDSVLFASFNIRPQQMTYYSTGILFLDKGKTYYYDFSSLTQIFLDNDEETDVKFITSSRDGSTIYYLLKDKSHMATILSDLSLTNKVTLETSDYVEFGMNKDQYFVFTKIDEGCSVPQIRRTFADCDNLPQNIGLRSTHHQRIVTLIVTDNNKIKYFQDTNIHKYYNGDEYVLERKFCTKN